MGGLQLFVWLCGGFSIREKLRPPFGTNPAFPINQKDAGDKNRGIGAHRHSNQQGKGKVVDDLPSQKKQCQHHQKCGSRGQYGSTQGLIDADVDEFGERAFATPSGIFPNPVEDDDGIVQGISDNGQKRRHDNQGEFLAGDGERPHGDEDIMNQRDDRGYGVLKIESP